MQRVVFDSFAVLAWFKREPAAPFVRSLLTDVRAGRLWGAICAVNVGEVYYVVSRERGPAAADELLEDMLYLDWQVLPASNDLVWAAARLKARYRISYADAFALACAQEHGADLVTDDPELRAAPHGVTLRWEV
jgi:ribonuclease VapC